MKRFSSVFLIIVAAVVFGCGCLPATAGQSGHRAAWQSENVNPACNNFFLDTLSTLDEAYLRPPYNGFLHFQDEVCPVAHRFLYGNEQAHPVLREMNVLYRRSLQHE